MPVSLPLRPASFAARRSRPTARIIHTNSSSGGPSRSFVVSASRATDDVLTNCSTSCVLPTPCTPLTSTKPPAGLPLALTYS